jgi:hypothetical protein
MHSTTTCRQELLQEGSRYVETRGGGAGGSTAADAYSRYTCSCEAPAPKTFVRRARLAGELGRKGTP